MLFIIDVHWTRRTPDPERENAGTTTYAEFAHTATRATSQATRKFRRHYGLHLQITRTAEKQPPPPILA